MDRLVEKQSLEKGTRTRSHGLINPYINLTVLLEFYPILGSLLGPGDKELKKVDKILALMEFAFQ